MLIKVIALSYQDEESIAIVNKSQSSQLTSVYQINLFKQTRRMSQVTARLVSSFPLICGQPFFQDLPLTYIFSHSSFLLNQKPWNIFLLTDDDQLELLKYIPIKERIRFERINTGWANLLGRLWLSQN